MNAVHRADNWLEVQWVTVANEPAGERDRQHHQRDRRIQHPPGEGLANSGASSRAP